MTVLHPTKGLRWHTIWYPKTTAPADIRQVIIGHRYPLEWRQVEVLEQLWQGGCGEQEWIPIPHVVDPLPTKDPNMTDPEQLTPRGMIKTGDIQAPEGDTSACEIKTANQKAAEALTDALAHAKDDPNGVH